MYTALIVLLCVQAALYLVLIGLGCVYLWYIWEDYCFGKLLDKMEEDENNA